MNYNESMEYMEAIKKYGSALGLDTIKTLLAKMGNPQDELKVIHVAGTNGKGSTSAFLQSILMESGYKTGRYSSPAVFEYREIIRTDNTYISEEEVADILTYIKSKCNEMVKESLPHPTPFEIETAMAFEYFKRKKCDVVLVECGMGGEGDATNVFKKVLCSVITTISLDHTKFLGSTIGEIARVKAGIIKDNCPVIVSNQADEAVESIKKIAELKKAPFILCQNAYGIKAEGFLTLYEYKASNGKIYKIELKMPGTYQVKNSITAIEAALALENRGFKVEENIEKGLLNANWPGRMEVINDSPLFIIDGAHNPGAIKELRDSIDLYFTNKKITFIMGVLADKDFKKEAEMIAGRGEMIITVTPDNERALNGEILADTIRPYNSNVICAKGMDEAVKMSINSVNVNNCDLIIAFGSLSYLKDLRRALKKYIKAKTNS